MLSSTSFPLFLLFLLFPLHSDRPVGIVSLGEAPEVVRFCPSQARRTESANMSPGPEPRNHWRLPSTAICTLCCGGITGKGAETGRTIVVVSLRSVVAILALSEFDTGRSHWIVLIVVPRVGSEKFSLTSARGGHGGHGEAAPTSEPSNEFRTF